MGRGRNTRNGVNLRDGATHQADRIPGRFLTNPSASTTPSTPLRKAPNLDQWSSEYDKEQGRDRYDGTFRPQRLAELPQS